MIVAPLTSTTPFVGFAVIEAEESVPSTSASLLNIDKAVGMLAGTMIESATAMGGSLTSRTLIVRTALNVALAELFSRAEETIERTPGVVLSVNEDLRMLAWSRVAQQELAIPATGAHGRPCYEIVSATDADTGRPCNETCPLARGVDRPGWAHSRILETEQLAGVRKRLNCFQLRYVTPAGERSNLCFLRPSDPLEAETQTRVLQAIESVYPMASGIADI